MSSMIVWMMGIGISVAAMVVAAAIQSHYLHMTLAAAVSIVVALSAFGESRENTEAGSEAGLVASANLRHMGLVWAWGALGLFVTYAFKILEWREWLHFFIAFLVLAGLSLFLSATLRKDSEEHQQDQTMLKVARGYSVFVLVAMLLTMVGLLVDGKMWRFMSVAGQRVGSQDWAANNIFFFGAMALAAVAWNAISNLRRSGN